MKRKIVSIVTDDLSHCYIHKKYLGILVDADHLHHMCHGVANRTLAEREKLVCGLCANCHQQLHDKSYHDIDLQRDAETAWLKHNKASIDDWIKLFGKNYLE